MTARVRRPGRYRPPRRACLFWRPPHGQNDTVCTCICSFKFLFLRLFYQLRLRLHDRAQEDGPALTLTNCAETPMPRCHRPGTIRMATCTADQVGRDVASRAPRRQQATLTPSYHLPADPDPFPGLPSTCTVRPPQRWFRAAPGAAGNPAPRASGPHVQPS